MAIIGEFLPLIEELNPYSEFLTDGATYKCLLGTSFGPVDNPSAWEVI